MNAIGLIYVVIITILTLIGAFRIIYISHKLDGKPVIMNFKSVLKNQMTGLIFIIPLFVMAFFHVCN